MTPVRRAIDLLSSGRLAVALLAVLAALLFLYLFLPQFGPAETGQLEQWVRRTGTAAELSRALGLTRIRSSWWLFGSVALLLVNLTACMARRVPAAIRAFRMAAPSPESFSRWPRRPIDGSGGFPGRIAPTLRRRGFRVAESAQLVYAVRGRQAILGHWLFHVGLLVLIAGGAIAAVRPDPFRGVAGIGQGESFRSADAAWLSTNAPPAAGMAGLEFRLERVRAATRGDRVLEFDAVLSTPRNREVHIGINRPYRYGPYQVLAQGFGFMPGWAIVDESGRMLRGAWVKLVPFPLEQEEWFSIGPRTSKVHFRFDPDGSAGDESTPAADPFRPVFETRIVLRGETVFEGRLEPGRRVSLGGGREFLFLPEVRRYVLLDVIEDRGHRAAFAAFAIMIAGLGLRYGRPRKEIVVRPGPDGGEMFGRAELFPHLFGEELDRLAAELAARRKPGDSGRVAA